MDVDEAMDELYGETIDGFMNNWGVKVLGFIWENWWYLTVGGIAALVTYKVLDRLLATFLLSVYKIAIGYRETLTRMKSCLEDDYGDLWDEPEFCIAYLKLHDAYQTFLNEARTDAGGKLRHDTRYEQFTHVIVGE